MYPVTLCCAGHCKNWSEQAAAALSLCIFRLESYSKTEMGTIIWLAFSYAALACVVCDMWRTDSALLYDPPHCVESGFQTQTLPKEGPPNTTTDGNTPTIYQLTTGTSTK